MTASRLRRVSGGASWRSPSRSARRGSPLSSRSAGADPRYSPLGLSHVSESGRRCRPRRRRGARAARPSVRLSGPSDGRRNRQSRSPRWAAQPCGSLVSLVISSPLRHTPPAGRNPCRPYHRASQSSPPASGSKHALMARPVRSAKTQRSASAADLPPVVGGAGAPRSIRAGGTLPRARRTRQPLVPVGDVRQAGGRLAVLWSFTVASPKAFKLAFGAWASDPGSGAGSNSELHPQPGPSMVADPFHPCILGRCAPGPTISPLHCLALRTRLSWRPRLAPPGGTSPSTTPAARESCRRGAVSRGFPPEGAPASPFGGAQCGGRARGRPPTRPGGTC